MVLFSRTLTGAWIETSMLEAVKANNTVAPSRVRGLKPSRKVIGTPGPQSHPHGCVD